MSKAFINSVSLGNNLEAEKEFSNVLGDKIGNALELKRKELAKDFVKTITVETEDGAEN